MHDILVLKASWPAASRSPCFAAVATGQLDLPMVVHAHATGGGFPGLRQQLPLLRYILIVSASA